MKKINFVIYGLLIALFGEIWRFLLIGEDIIPGFLGWMLIVVSYVIIFFLGIWALKIKSKVYYYITFGLIGVFIEFLLLGTNPFEHWIILLWVISFWGGIVTIPRLIVYEKISKKTVYFIFVSLVFFVLLFFFTKESSMLAFFYISMNIPYLWEFRK